MPTNNFTNDFNDELQAAVEGVSRRSIVRGAGTAALAIPLITVATAAPALAASPVATLSLSLAGVTRTKDTLIVQARILNIGDATTAVAPTLTVTLEPNVGTDHAKRPIKGATTGFGWHQAAVPPTDGVNSPWHWTFLYGTKLKKGQATTTLKFGLGLGANGFLSLFGSHPPVPNPYGGTFTFDAIAGSAFASSKQSVV